MKDWYLIIPSEHHFHTRSHKFGRQNQSGGGYDDEDDDEGGYSYNGYYGGVDAGDSITGDKADRLTIDWIAGDKVDRLTIDWIAGDKVDRLTIDWIVVVYLNFYSNITKRRLTWNGQSDLQALISGGRSCKPSVTQSLAPPTTYVYKGVRAYPPSSSDYT
uniref:Uncharacterized protein n=1 Tax=Timema tahoe TaxID=61484 RepID=A0A7R9INX8_9NEOP|nr:unnamed protein product [Timema tahoe]